MKEGRGGDDPVQGLMTRLGAGDRRALAPLYEALWPLCLARARRSLADVGEAEDAAQRALLKLLGQAAAFDPRRSAVGWALSLTDWECRTSARRQQRRREVAVDDAIKSAEEPAEGRLFQAERLRQLQAATARLSPEDRDTLRSVLADEGPRDPAFRKRKQRVMERLRRLLGRQP